MKQGMLICLVSKNNSKDVWEVFDRRKDMPLSKDDIVGAKINWESKSRNIKALATELNLGIDSIVFLDDNPVECAEVAAHCPGVLTINTPQDPEDLPAFLSHIWAFDHVNVTEEDKKGPTCIVRIKKGQNTYMRSQA